MRKAAVFVSLVGLALLTGCLGGPADTIDADISPDTEPVDMNETGEEVLASALNSTKEIGSYTVESEHRFVAGASGFFNMNLSMESTGEFDREAEEARVDSRGTVDFSAFSFLDNETDFETSVYSDGETVYARSVENGDDTGWSERGGNFSLVESVLGVDGVAELSRDTDAELLGGETVDGVETYVVSVNATPERLSRHSSAVIGLHGAGIEQRQDLEGVEEPPEEGETQIQELQTYVWVERDTRRPVRVAYFMSMGPPEDVEGEGSGNTTEGEGEDVTAGTVDFLFEADYDYAETDIEAPEGV
jgi:hypothetical protein